MGYLEKCGTTDNPLTGNGSSFLRLKTMLRGIIDSESFAVIFRVACVTECIPSSVCICAVFSPNPAPLNTLS